jgi:hypothetical protein
MICMNKNDPNHPVKRKYRVTILRHDGTPFVVEHAKHVLHKNGNPVIEIYLGEHNVDRKMIWMPWDKIDHVIITEENE